jgi:hypothetical protein
MSATEGLLDDAGSTFMAKALIVYTSHLTLIAAERAWERLSAPTPFLFIEAYIRRRH